LRYPFDHAFRRLGTVAGSYYFFANRLLTRLIPSTVFELTRTRGSIFQAAEECLNMEVIHKKEYFTC
jgi:hypothetical protein